MAFSDAFNRADGSLGNGWALNSGTVTIVSSNAVSAASAIAVNSNTDGTTYQEASVTTIGNPTGAEIVCPVVKGAASGLHYYYGRVYLFSGTWYASIFKTDNGNTELAYTPLSGPIPGELVTRLVYDDGHLSFYVDGTLTTQADDSTLSAYTQSGMAFPPGGGTASLFEAADAAVGPYLTISPSEVYVAAPASYLSVTLVGATWGDPAMLSGELSVNHGWLITQFKDTTTLASFSYQAMAYVGEVTVTDGETGAQGTFMVRAFPVASNGDSWPLDEDGAALINNGDHSCPSAAILTTCTDVDPPNDISITKALDAILEQLGGFPGQTGADIGAVSIPATILEQFVRTVVKPYWSLEDVVGSLGGSPTVYSNADLYTALGNLPAATYQPVLDALVALQGPTPPTLADLGTMISDLASISGYSLQDVKDWIDAIPTVDLSPITAKLSLIQPSTAADLTTVTNDVNNVHSDLGAAAAVISHLTSADTLTIQTVLDAISALSDLVSNLSLNVLPIWPGLAGVTLGAPVALSEQVTVDGPLDGVLVNVTTPPTGLGRYNVGGKRLDYGQMRITFETDNGDLEPWQYFGFEQAIYTPKTMAHAAKCRLSTLGALAGTVTPWSVS